MLPRQRHRFACSGQLAAVALVLVACGSSKQGEGANPPADEPGTGPQERATAPEPTDAPHGQAVTVPYPTDSEPVPDLADVLQAIARDIEGLKPEYPQLAEFSAGQHYDAERLVISYGYRTHRPQRRAGWAGGVPNPDPDGVWFYIDLHDPDSMAQIHTQPVVPAYRFRDKKVLLLLLEGRETKSLHGALQQILTDHGVERGSPDASPARP